MGGQVPLIMSINTSSEVSFESFHMFSDCNSSHSSSDDASIIITDDIDEEYDEEHDIPVITNINRNFSPESPSPACYDAYLSSQELRIPVRKTIKRDGRLNKSILLPFIAVSNLSSLMLKVKNFAEDIHERNIGLTLLTEVWQKKYKKKHIFEVEKLMQMEGLKYISTTCPSSKRGGGYLKNLTLEKNDILIPHNLEIVWGVLRPKNYLISGLKEIIAVSFYCPPRSPKKSKLLDHIMTTVQI